MSSSKIYTENDRPTQAWCDPERLHVLLADGRELTTPLRWCPRLANATAAQRNNVELMLGGVHWPDLDEDVSVRGMQSGWKYPTAVPPKENAA